jgi:hypothetical protein
MESIRTMIQIKPEKYVPISPFSAIVTDKITDNTLLIVLKKFDYLFLILIKDPTTKAT